MKIAFQVGDRVQWTVYEYERPPKGKRWAGMGAEIKVLKRGTIISCGLGVACVSPDDPEQERYRPLFISVEKLSIGETRL